MSTPVEFLAARNPACNETIRELSGKWAERTKKLATKWPAGGTFDVAMCKEMEVLIKNYKTNDTSKKRNEKRERELGVLTLFKQYGIKLIKLEKQERENKNNETKEERPPPYAPSCDQAVNQMPVVQGKIDLKGPIELEGYLHDENTDVEKEQSCTREVRGTVGSREKTHTHTAMREGLEQPRERLRTSTPLSQPRQRERERERENSPQGGAKDGKREG